MVCECGEYSDCDCGACNDCCECSLLNSYMRKNPDEEEDEDGNLMEMEGPPTITLEAGDFGWDFILRSSDGRTLLIQTDYDYPGTAISFGWVPCKCGMTDGTINCGHKYASEMIVNAGNFLRKHIGDEVEDPGYFNEEDGEDEDEELLEDLEQLDEEDEDADLRHNPEKGAKLKCEKCNYIFNDKFFGDDYYKRVIGSSKRFAFKQICAGCGVEAKFFWQDPKRRHNPVRLCPKCQFKFLAKGGETLCDQCRSKRRY